MPIYEYQCQDCGHQKEALQKLSDGPLVDCPACGQPRLKKKISAAGFRLKGGGWYETDFKKTNQKNLAGERSSSESKSADSAGAGKSGDKVAKPASTAGSGS